MDQANNNVAPEGQGEEPNGSNGQIHTDLNSPGAHSKKSMYMWLGVGLAVVLLGGAAAWWMMGNKEPAPEPIVKRTYKVGVMTIDNFQQSPGLGVKRGVELATQVVKSERADIELVLKATDCKADLAKTAMEEFVAEGVVAVVGEFCSDATLAAAAVANENKIPLISGASTSAAVTTAGDYVFRTIPSDVLAIEYTAGVMYNKHKVRTVAILHSNDTYGNGGRDALKASFEKLGGTIVSDEAYEKTQTDVRDALKRGKAANPDAFYTLGATGINPAILIQKKEVGFTTQMYGPETFKSERNITAAEGAAEGIFVIGGSDPARSFSERYQATFNEAVGSPYTAYYYDAMQAIIKALDAGATTGETLKTELYKVSFTGASSSIKFDTNGDVKGSYSLYTIKDGKAALVE